MKESICFEIFLIIIFRSGMNLKPEEQILIKDIFAVSINKNENSLLYLPEFVRDVSAFGSCSLDI